MSKAWDKSKLSVTYSLATKQKLYIPTRGDDFETLLSKIQYFEDNYDKIQKGSGPDREKIHPLEIIINYHKEIFVQSILYGGFIIKLKTKKPSLYLKHKDVLEPPLKREIKRRKMVKNILIIIALIIVIFFLVFM